MGFGETAVILPRSSGVGGDSMIYIRFSERQRKHRSVEVAIEHYALHGPEHADRGYRQ